MAEDSDLDPLRDPEEFKKLMVELQTTEKTPNESRPEILGDLPSLAGANRAVGTGVAT